MIRKYLQEDRSWIEPIARKYDEWDMTDNILLNPELFGVVGIWVIPEKAIIGIYQDEHGYVGAGLCDESGIRQLIKLGRFVMDLVKEIKLDLHTHVEKNSWQYRFFEQLGFVPEEDYLRWYAIEGYKERA